jgi:hypothetical protein
MDRIVVINTLFGLSLPSEKELLMKNSTESAWFLGPSSAVADGKFELTLRNAGVPIVGLMKLLQDFGAPSTTSTTLSSVRIPSRLRRLRRAAASLRSPRV